MALEELHVQSFSYSEVEHILIFYCHVYFFLCQLIIPDLIFVDFFVGSANKKIFFFFECNLAK